MLWQTYISLGCFVLLSNFMKLKNNIEEKNKARENVWQWTQIPANICVFPPVIYFFCAINHHLFHETATSCPCIHTQKKAGPKFVAALCFSSDANLFVLFRDLHSVKVCSCDAVKKALNHLNMDFMIATRLSWRIGSFRQANSIFCWNFSLYIWRRSSIQHDIKVKFQ